MGIKNNWVNQKESLGEELRKNKFSNSGSGGRSEEKEMMSLRIFWMMLGEWSELTLKFLAAVTR